MKEKSFFISEEELSIIVEALSMLNPKGKTKHEKAVLQELCADLSEELLLYGMSSEDRIKRIIPKKLRDL